MSSTEVVPRNAYDGLKLALTNNQDALVRACRNSGMDVQGMMQAVLNAAITNEDILSCDPRSIIGAALVCAATGLQPGPLGYAYIVPYGRGRERKAQFQMGYKGYIKLAYESGLVANIFAAPVFPEDTFDYELGLEPRLVHKPDKDIDRTDARRVAFVYGVIIKKDGSKAFDVMSRAEVDRIRDMSKAGANAYGPWAQHYVEMAKKTVLHRLFKTEYLGDRFARYAAQDEKTITWTPQVADKTDGDALAAGDETVYEPVVVLESAASEVEETEVERDNVQSDADLAATVDAPVEATPAQKLGERVKAVSDDGELASSNDIKWLTVTLKNQGYLDDEKFWRKQMRGRYGALSRKDLTHEQAQDFIKVVGRWPARH